MKNTITIAFLLLSTCLYAQKQGQDGIDSLVNAIPAEKNDTIRVRMLRDIASDYRLINPDEGIKYGRQALDLAIKKKWEKGIALSYSSIASNYQYKSDYPNAFEYDFKALKKFEALGDKRGMANCLRSIGTVYQYKKNYQKALEYDLNALKIFEELGDKRGISSNLSNLGIFYFSQQDYDKAIEYDTKALKISDELGDHNSVAVQMGNIGDAYMHKKDYKNALEYDAKALKAFREQGDKYSTAIALGNTGETYLAIAKDSLTRSASEKAESLKQAISYLNEAIEASRKIDQLDNIIEFSQYLSDAYSLAGKYKDALESYKLYSTMNDSVYSSENNFRIKQTEHQHDLELKDKDLKLARLELAFLVAGIALLLLVIIMVLRNSISQKKTNQLLSKEKKRSDDLLLNILPSEVADELKETGTAAAKYFDNVTVMFTDFVDFTIAGEKMSPQQLVDELHACFMAFDEIIRRHGIEKIKTVGDAYLAVSGLPIPDAKHASKMVSAAAEIIAFMKERKKKLGASTFEVRIGMHSGSVVAGIVGMIKFAYDIWGDTVNTAARMEETGEAGKINISQTTYDLVKDEFACTYRGEIEAKNKGMLKMYFANIPNML